MKTKKLLRKVKALFGAERRAQIAKYESLEKVLKKLGKKEDALRQKMKAEGDKQRRRELRRKIRVIDAQRTKGAKLMAEIEKRRKD